VRRRAASTSTASAPAGPRFASSTRRQRVRRRARPKWPASTSTPASSSTDATARLEHLCRYLARPPIAKERLELAADGRVVYTMKKPWRDGTRAVDRSQLLLAACMSPSLARKSDEEGAVRGRR
jgi:hypothetical protein